MIQRKFGVIEMVENECGQIYSLSVSKIKMGEAALEKHIFSMWSVSKITSRNYVLEHILMYLNVFGRS